MSTVRTRIAPSPTGDPHVGTAYIALFNLCFARQHNGQFILRIEDTDQVRSTDASEQKILNSLKWLGLQWDEGPDVGGDYGPYRQSERSDIYQEHAQRLLESGDAFHCFCTQDRLQELRKSQMENKEQPGYDGHCCSLSAEDVAKKKTSGDAFVVRMKVPGDGICEVKDMLRGKIDIDWAQVDMQILMKADGMPTYHLANVVDDHLMEITHVIRGEEWINSAPKHLLLYKYFGWEAPVFCHLPLLRNPDKSKLSKRKNPTSISYYERMGFLPEALVNYLGRMGWSLPSEEEKFSLQAMIDNFDIQRVSLGGPIFDVEKLEWLNGAWLREEFSDDQLVEKIQIWALNKDFLMPMLPHLKQRISTFSDLAPLAAFMLSGKLSIGVEDFSHKKLEEDQVKQILQFALWELEVLQVWDREAISELMMDLAEKMDIKIRDFLFPIFIAIAGTSASISVMDSMSLIGPDMTRSRLRNALDVFGGIGKKQLKKLEKAYQKVMS